MFLTAQSGMASLLLNQPVTVATPLGSGGGVMLPASVVEAPPRPAAPPVPPVVEVPAPPPVDVPTRVPALPCWLPPVPTLEPPDPALVVPGSIGSSSAVGSSATQTHAAHERQRTPRTTSESQRRTKKGISLQSRRIFAKLINDWAGGAVIGRIEYSEPAQFGRYWCLHGWRLATRRRTSPLSISSRAFWGCTVRYHNAEKKPQNAGAASPSCRSCILPDVWHQSTGNPGAQPW